MNAEVLPLSFCHTRTLFLPLLTNSSTPGNYPPSRPPPRFVSSTGPILCCFWRMTTHRLPPFISPSLPRLHAYYSASTEIYRIVSSKQLESSADAVKAPGAGDKIVFSETPTDGGKKSGGCC